MQPTQSKQSFEVHRVVKSGNTVREEFKRSNLKNEQRVFSDFRTGNFGSFFDRPQGFDSDIFNIRSHFATTTSNGAPGQSNAEGNGKSQTFSCCAPKWLKVLILCAAVVIILLCGGYAVHHFFGQHDLIEASFSECGRPLIKIPSAYIAGKAKKAQEGQWPWLVPLFLYPLEIDKTQLPHTYVCGSTLITKWHLLSAAHCTSSDKMVFKPKDFFAVPGHFNISGIEKFESLFHNISVIYVHEEFIPNSSYFKSKNDIAVFRMQEGVTFGKLIQPACFPRAQVHPSLTWGIVAGYGRKTAERPNVLTPRYTKLNVIDTVQCIFENEAYASVMSNLSFCAGYSEAVPCSGDSGSGFFVQSGNLNRYSVIGIVSQGLNALNCDPKDFVVFVDVLKIADWVVDKVTSCNGTEDCVDRCELNACAEHALCISKTNNKFSCECQQGYEGDPYVECNKKGRF